MMSCVRSLVAVMWQGICRGCAARVREVREHRARIVAVLFPQARKVDAAAIDARRRAGLQSAHSQRKLAQPCGERIGGRIAGPAARMAFETDVDPAAEERADGQHHARRSELDAARGEAARHALAVAR